MKGVNASLEPREGRHNRSPQRKLWEIGSRNSTSRRPRARGQSQDPQLALWAAVMPPLTGLRRIVLATLLLCAVAFGQDARPISLRDAVQIALEQNPEITLARIRQAKAEQTVQIAKGAFSPVAFVGSGLGYTDGIPQSVEGTTPSVVQAGGRMTLYDKSSLARIQQAKDGAEAARYVAADKEDEIAFQVASTYLDFERSSQLLDRIRSQRRASIDAI